MKEVPAFSGNERTLPSDPGSSGLVMTSLVGGILLPLFAFLFLLLAPALDCPECKGGTVGVFTLEETPNGSIVGGCPTCGGKGKVTLVKLWKFRRDDDPR